MMGKTPLSLKFITGFSVVGLCFSGVLSAIKLFSGTCAVRESCPYLLGIPVCVYGFALYAAMTFTVVRVYKRQTELTHGLLTTGAIALLGILFSGYFSILELPVLIREGFGAFTFGVPTCMIGLVLYMLIFATSALGWAHNKER